MSVKTIMITAVALISVNFSVFAIPQFPEISSEEWGKILVKITAAKPYTGNNLSEFLNTVLGYATEKKNSSTSKMTAAINKIQMGEDISQ